MPCRVEGDGAVYETARSPPTALEMGQSDGVFFRALRQRDQRPYKRYVSPCRRQRDWPVVRARLMRLRDRAEDETGRLLRLQAEYDARTLRETLPPLLAALRVARAVNNQPFLASFADRIEALDAQGRVAIAPWLARNECAKPRSRLKRPIEDYKALSAARTDLDVVLAALEAYTTQFDVTRGGRGECPRLVIGTNDERVDPIWLEPFVPSQFVIVRASDHDGRHVCLPLDTIVAYARSLAVVQDSGERRWVAGSQQFEDGPGRGERYSPVMHLFAYGNAELMHVPLSVPVLRIRRLRSEQWEQ